MQRKGPGLWLASHTAARVFRHEPDTFWHLFPAILGDHLSCPKCRRDTEEYMAEHPEGRDDPVSWLWKFHNHVNLKLGKQVFPHPDSGSDGKWSEPKAEHKGIAYAHVSAQRCSLVLSGYYL